MRVTCRMSEAAFELLAPTSSGCALICAEHAGIRVPRGLGSLGLSGEELYRHIGWDIGIEKTARLVHQSLGLPVLLGRYSRLVVDLNRPVHSKALIVEESDGTPIPGNLSLSTEERAERTASYYLPFHKILNTMITKHRPNSILSLHSFTPKLRRSGRPRRWHCGVLYDREISRDACLGRACLTHLKSIEGLIVGDNQPYRVEHDRDDSVPLHGELKGVPTVLLEIRNDLISDGEGQRRWSEIVTGLIRACLCSGVPARPLTAAA